jgi:hypothetical protein
MSSDTRFYGPVSKDRRPWNAGRRPVAKHPSNRCRIGRSGSGLIANGRTSFDLAIDSKLRGCDVVKVKIGDVVSGGRVRSTGIVLQTKTGRPVWFDLLEQARGGMLAWLERRGGTLGDFILRSQPDHKDQQHSSVCQAHR